MILSSPAPQFGQCCMSAAAPGLVSPFSCRNARVCRSQTACPAPVPPLLTWDEGAQSALAVQEDLPVAQSHSRDGGPAGNARCGPGGGKAWYTVRRGGSGSGARPS
jgi:hypothetical protein